MDMEEKSKRKNIEEFVEIMLEACEEQFPKKCSCCGRYFETFQDFLSHTIIPVHSKDHSLQLIDSQDLHDVIAFRNCSCGTTMTVQCAVDKPQKKELVHAISEEARERGVEPEDVAQLLRDKVIKRAKACNTTKR
ncbi:hypothetical protein Flexsi_1973 [Flexistipes sinusarabici DSM 4947]|uniref:C2H2-type domain-containing protein n=2 Tax=Flexistipes sinusarabici TaxID=2352 RepID=F8E4P4_FLESM|nr:hypothetical protein Flexsi_1973 [Flexistipes sinusarabici DSM 4947]